MTQQQQETTRILAEYDRRRREISPEFYSLTRPANLFLRHSQETALLRALIGAQVLPLNEKRLLEVGCGTGQWYTLWQNLGMNPNNLAGIELDALRAEICQQTFPHADIRTGDARQLPWEDGGFDVVFQSTVFTSILDVAFQAAIANEMLRVLKPSGIILWYDFQFNNPRNANVRGISLRQLRQLFPNCKITSWRTTLAPPLARAVAPRCRWFAYLLESLRLLNTHLVACIRKPAT